MLYDNVRLTQNKESKMPKKKKKDRKEPIKFKKPAKVEKVLVEQRSDEDLLQLAKDMVDEKIFFDGQLPPEFDFMLMQIFAPLEPSLRKELIDFNDVGMIYEYLEKNIKEEKESMPMFNTMNMVHKEDMPKLHELYTEAFSDKHGEGELERLRALEAEENQKVMDDTDEEHVHGPDCSH